MITKTEYTLEWALPGSIDARRFGWGKQGCWVVDEVVTRDGVQNTLQARAGFLTKEGAQSYLDNMKLKSHDTHTQASTT